VTSVPAPGDPRKLAWIGHLLYGAQHIEYLSRILGVDRKTVYRWRRGVTPVPAYVWEPLKVALMKRRNDIKDVLANLDS
tara:strand:- start:12424 stop:12660 length:237 start_codon:yes stop_codon:yes gene_type:complete